MNSIFHKNKLEKESWKLRENKKIEKKITNNVMM